MKFKTTPEDRKAVSEELAGYGPKLALTPNYFVLRLIADLDAAQARIAELEQAATVREWKAERGLRKEAEARASRAEAKAAELERDYEHSRKLLYKQAVDAAARVERTEKALRRGEKEGRS